MRGSINYLFDCDIKDIMTGFCGFSYGFVKTLFVLSKGFEIETEIFRVLGTIFKLYRDYKPFGFFSILALILALISTLFFIPVLLDYFSTGLVLKVPTLIVCGFAMLAAIQSFFARLILSNIAQKSRRDFEYCFNCVCEKERRSRDEDE